MKFAALVPALFVLVSMCGSPVPPPPGSITGLVFYDANHNAIHDLCDSGLGRVKIVATNTDGTSSTATTNNDGIFVIEDAQPGDTVLSVAAADGYAWPITTIPADAAGTPVHVESNKDSSGLEIGAASHAPFAISAVSIVGAVFNDTNKNGFVDRDECGRRNSDSFVSQAISVDNKPFAAIASNGSFELRNVGNASGSDPKLAYTIGN